jgi:hypothetical protein
MELNTQAQQREAVAQRRSLPPIPASVYMPRKDGKIMMKTFVILISSVIVCVACNQTQEVSASEKNQVVSLENNLVQVNFDLASGYYQIVDMQDKTLCIDSAYAQINDWKTTDPLIRTHSVAQDAGGQSLLIECADAGNKTLLLRFSLQKDKPYLILSAGIDNLSDDIIIVKTIAPLAGAKLFKGKDVTKNLRILDGNGGGEVTKMNYRPAAHSRNNMLLFFGEGDDSRSLVLGGVTYREFNKSIQLGEVEPRRSPFYQPTPAKPVSDNPSLRLYAEDELGKRLDPKTRYLPDGDRFYLDCVTRNPFLSLETYGRVFSEMQNAHPNYYHFPTLCLWYASVKHYGGKPGRNNSVGAVEEMRIVKESGWLKYTTMGIRLVPDCYAPDNENGWWDDEHWQKRGHYLPPYETTEKWAQAVTALGGIPLTYFQTNVYCRDFAERFPSQMLFNENAHKVPKTNTPDWDLHSRGYSAFDFTDEDFKVHIRNVYKNLNDGGVRGLMYDYPDTGWPVFGGVDDQHVTAGAVYRSVFQFARDGLGKDAWLHERNLYIGSDISLDIVSSQRIWGDTDIATPEMFSRGGLRWYKSRVVTNYDMDAKNLLKAAPDNEDGLHKLLTMSYTAGSRLLLANSFSTLGSERIFALSRIFPYHSSTLTARPVDMLLRDYPSIYSFRINDDWQQVVFYNQNDKNSDTLSAGLSDKAVIGGLELSADKSYYVYDFWNRKFIGKLRGNDRLVQELRPGEARVMSVHAVENHPQILSTDRHLLQGYVELSDIKWDAAAKTLKGKAQLVEGEPMTITVAPNGFTYLDSSSAVTEKDGLLELVLKNDTGGNTEWRITFK